MVGIRGLLLVITGGYEWVFGGYCCCCCYCYCCCCYFVVVVVVCQKNLTLKFVRNRVNNSLDIVVLVFVVVVVDPETYL